MGRFIIGMCNALIKALGFVLSGICVLLPPSPFKLISNSVISPYLQQINYFVPVNEMLSIGQAWLTAIGIYYLYQIILRWVKAIN